jgi:hypothetical protein
MGELTHANNGDEQFWNIEISCNQWEGSVCTQSALIFFFFLFKFWVAGRDKGRIFFIFHLFPTFFLQVPIRKGL